MDIIRNMIKSDNKLIKLGIILAKLYFILSLIWMSAAFFITGKIFIISEIIMMAIGMTLYKGNMYKSKTFIDEWAFISMITVMPVLVLGDSFAAQGILIYAIICIIVRFILIRKL